MKKIFILTINGTIHVFNRDNINDNLIDMLEKYAKKLNEKSLYFKFENDAYEYFVNQVQTELNIILNEIPITNIIRMNINTN